MDNTAMSVRKRKIRTLLVVLMLVFIWGNSLLSGAASSQESEYIRELLEPLLNIIQRCLEKIDIQVTQSTLVRKLAHFVEYMMLGFFMGLLVEKKNGLPRFFLPGFLCVSAACVDEFLQGLAVDRGPSIRDVVLDASGATVGVLLAVVFICIHWLRRNW